MANGNGLMEGSPPSGCSCAYCGGLWAAAIGYSSRYCSILSGALVFTIAALGIPETEGDRACIAPVQCE